MRWGKNWELIEIKLNDRAHWYSEMLNVTIRSELDFRLSTAFLRLMREGLTRRKKDFNLILMIR